jgi:hypothetical protein
MSEPDFAALRSGVEQATRLPEFEDVAARGRRRLRRRRLATTLWSLGAMIVCLPGLAYLGVALASNSDRPGVVQIAIVNGGNDDPTNAFVTLPGPKATVTTHLVAAAGVDLANSYGLIDACRGDACSLQLISLSTDPSTERIGLLRGDPSDTLTSARVVALDPTEVMISAQVGNGIGPVAKTLDLGSVFATKPPVTPVMPLEPVQTTSLGKIEAVGSDGEIRPIPHQPELASIILAGGGHGWWVTGADRDTGELAVAFSHDQGTTWHTSELGVVPETGAQPILATPDGTHVYLLVRSGGRMLLIRSSDGGATWAAPIPEAGWNASGDYGLITPADGSLGVWLANDGADAVSYRRSVDHGTTFKVVTGKTAPSGRVVSIPGGYVTLGAHPTMSVDGHTWRSITMPFVPPD